jgi:hypothetical protein
LLFEYALIRCLCNVSQPTNFPKGFFTDSSVQFSSTLSGATHNKKLLSHLSVLNEVAPDLGFVNQLAN